MSRSHARRQQAKEEAEIKKNWRFWATQPVIQKDEKVLEDEEGCPIDKVKDPEKDIQAQPYNLPGAFEWVDIDVNDEKELTEVYELLRDNYVEDDDNMFRFDYSRSFLMWALKPPGFLKQWHLGVRHKSKGILMGFISAIPATIKMYKKKQEMVEINFLCVHKALRTKRLAPVLIKEITRRVNRQGLFQAVYTAGVWLPSPVARCQYWHRSLNPRKLIAVGFSHLKKNMTMPRTEKLYRLPAKTKHNLRPMTMDDVPQVFKLVTTYLDNYDLSPSFTSEEELAHWLIPKPGVIDTYVIEDKENAGTVTDVVSFYTISSSVIGHDRYKKLKAAYSYYNVCTKTPLLEVMNDALILAKKADFDVFNCLDIFENSKFLTKLKFGKGDGRLSYYLYNWRCPPMEPPRVGLVLL